MTVNWVTELLDYSEDILTHVTTDGVKYGSAFFGALALSLALTPLCREAARKLGMIDQPDARRINRVPIPRGGGLSVFVTFHVVLGLLVLGLGGPLSHKFSFLWQKNFLLASSLLVLIGLLDDKFAVRASVKLFGQIAVASILYFSGVRLGGLFVAFAPWLDYAVTVFWMVGAINAFNLIDGLDGLASGLGVIAAMGLAGALFFTGYSADMLPYLVLAGACLGFLRYNFHPASVFLGDTGSMFIGLCLATLPLMTGSRKELVASLGVPLLAMGVPLFDTMLAIWRRTVRAMLPHTMGHGGGMRSRLMSPDKDHVHHRLLRETVNQRMVATMLYGVSASLVTVGIVGTVLKNKAPGLFLIAFIVAIGVVVKHLERVELWDTGRLLSHKRQTLRQGLLVPLYIVSDAFWLCCVWVLARWLSHMPLVRPVFLSNLPLYVVPSFLFLVLARTYWRVWSRAQIRDFAGLVLSLFAGSLFGLGLVLLFSEGEAYMVRFALLYAAFSVFPIVGVRLWRDSVNGVMQGLEKRILLEKSDTKRILAYGGGVRFRSYLREFLVRSGANNRVIIGIMDDDILLKGRIIAGFTVLGQSDQLDELLERYPVDEIVITCLLPPERLRQVVEVAWGRGKQVAVWSCAEEILAQPR